MASDLSAEHITPGDLDEIIAHISGIEIFLAGISGVEKG
jgi:hypothetical protein